MRFCSLLLSMESSPYWYLVLLMCLLRKEQSETTTDTQSDRQSNRQMHRQTDRQTDRHTVRQTVKQTDAQTDRHTHTHTDRHTDTQVDSYTVSYLNDVVGCFQDSFILCCSSSWYDPLRSLLLLLISYCPSWFCV